MLCLQRPTINGMEWMLDTFMGVPVKFDTMKEAKALGFAK